MGKQEVIQRIRERIKNINEFKEDLGKQMVVMMGLPAAGKSTFVSKHLKKYFPKASGFSTTNSDAQVKRLQYETAQGHLETLKKKVNSEKDLERFLKETTFIANDKKERTLPIDYKDLDEIKNMSIKQYFQKFYKPFYAVYFDIRTLAQSNDEELFQTKIYKGSDVVIYDTTAKNYSKVMKRLEQAKKAGFVNTIVYLDVDYKLSITRDIRRGKQKGRTVGASVIKEYAKSMEDAYKEYVKNGKRPDGVVDRLMRFNWVQTGSGPYDGKWRKVEDKRFSLKRGK